ncbi:hypothetical protein F383_04902 [Gossypium arboreum]|uniref:Uncharacterized protein n=1 Tax=Gossypium arboreum TaxID=29729 RepID=A0A0B0NFV3_GOSAR|nr:hypothetical protein F383_04902 [Gossypium arboreum]
MSGTSIGYEMCQCKTMSGRWHRHGYAKASVCPCLGHVISLDDDNQCKTMSETWHRQLTPCLRIMKYSIVFRMVQRQESCF